MIAACSSHDWTTKPTQPMSGKLLDTGYAIVLPAGMVRKSEASWAESWSLPGDEHGPSVTIYNIGADSPHPRHPASLDDEVTALHPSTPDAVVRKQAIAGGFAITSRPLPDRISAHVFVSSGTKALSCDANGTGGDRVQAALEKICDSLQIQ